MITGRELAQHDYCSFAYSALASFRMFRSISRRDYCTIKVSGTVCFKTVDPEEKVPVTTKL
jgi:hypothetical protein